MLAFVFPILNVSPCLVKSVNFVWMSCKVCQLPRNLNNSLRLQDNPDHATQTKSVSMTSQGLEGTGCATIGSFCCACEYDLHTKHFEMNYKNSLHMFGQYHYIFL